jgi:hypothetical protein
VRAELFARWFWATVLSLLQGLLPKIEPAEIRKNMVGISYYVYWMTLPPFDVDYRVRERQFVKNNLTDAVEAAKRFSILYDVWPGGLLKSNQGPCSHENLASPGS